MTILLMTYSKLLFFIEVCNMAGESVVSYNESHLSCKEVSRFLCSVSFDSGMPLLQVFGLVLGQEW